MKQWLFERFLPAWCREELLEENRRLTRRAEELWQENQCLTAYINGLETALRSQRHKVIYSGVKG